MPYPTISQIGLCANDLPQAKSFYMEVLGFKDARAKLLCGPRVAAVQELGSNASLVLNWLIGRRKFVQLEMFQHVLPPQRPLPSGWRVSDIGWGRFGVLLGDFDACLSRLAERGVALIAGPLEIQGRRRASFRDPFAGIVVELIEDTDARPDSNAILPPALANVAVSVSDLEAARKFWLDDIGLPENPDFVIDVDREKLWGLGENADASGFCVTLDKMSIEVVSYRTPNPRVYEDRLLSDQGIMNVGLGFRDRDSLALAVQRLEERGYAKSVPVGPGPIAATYIRGPEQVSVELFCCPEEFEDRIGFLESTDKPLF